MRLVVVVDGSDSAVWCGGGSVKAAQVSHKTWNGDKASEQHRLLQVSTCHLEASIRLLLAAGEREGGYVGAPAHRHY